MKKTIIRLAVGAVLFAIAIRVPAEPYLLKLAVYLAAYLEIGYKVLWKAIRNISRGKVFDENFLMAGCFGRSLRNRGTSGSGCGYAFLSDWGTF